ncbi:hypothetical protein F4V57_02590 [Acinetobacter qingfengensis]|uniref:hypothetical protein n=1 Tax=Acinetobacter qingfengensis TaxID=1262585 RepID=UPI0012385AAD|nr:hypothetical protein [Acinetobacter qingfengensis]KAA8734674.1 hypothetical protein F4V57_02590 [Acinetobacter qingfengensis]
MNMNDLNSLANALMFLAFNAFVIGCICGAFFSGHLSRILFDLGDAFRRPSRIQLKDGSYLYLWKGRYTTYEDKFSAMRLRLKALKKKRQL